MTRFSEVLPRVYRGEHGAWQPWFLASAYRPKPRLRCDPDQVVSLLVAIENSYRSHKLKVEAFPAMVPYLRDRRDDVRKHRKEDSRGQLLVGDMFANNGGNKAVKTVKGVALHISLIKTEGNSST